MAYDPATGLWKPEKDSVSARLTGLLKKSSPLMQQAKTTGLQIANSRNLLNSSMAVGAAQNEMIKAATPIAMADSEAGTRRDLSAQDFSQRGELQTGEFGQQSKLQESAQVQERTLQATEIAESTRSQAAKEAQQTGLLASVQAQQTRESGTAQTSVERMATQRIAGELDRTRITTAGQVQAAAFSANANLVIQRAQALINPSGAAGTYPSWDASVRAQRQIINSAFSGSAALIEGIGRVTTITGGLSAL